MHASVERIEVEIADLTERITIDLTERITILGGRMESVEAAVVRLEPHIANVNLAVRPLRRARARLPGRPETEPRRRLRGAGGRHLQLPASPCTSLTDR